MERIDPKRVLEDLKAEATTRKRRSLDLVHKILIDQGESGSRDFSIATIGRLCAEAGGPSPQSIRNKGGADYRRLIEAHATFHGTTRKKPLSATSRGNLPRSAEDLLKRIEEPALRAVFGSIVAERNALAQECRVLKANVELVVDRREEHGPPSNGGGVAGPHGPVDADGARSARRGGVGAVARSARLAGIR
jgi:hypothetical protein